MILAILPVLTGAIAMAWERQLPTRLWWLGCAVAFAGEILPLYDLAADAVEATITGDLAGLAVDRIMSLGYVAGARLQRLATWRAVPLSGVVPPGCLRCYCSPLALLCSISPACGGWPAATPGRGLLRTGAIGRYQIIAYILWYWALGTGGIARVGLFQFLQPVSGVILAGIILAEALTPVFLFASAE